MFGSNSAQKKPGKKEPKFDYVKDEIFEDARQTDCIIAIMGPTGSGKTTFINHLLGPGKATLKVNEGLKSCTQKLQPVEIVPDDRYSAVHGRLLIVDTPGFDDTSLTDEEVLRRISYWLATSYNTSMKLTGLIYLHDMTMPRMFGTTLSYLEVFRKLCGDKNMPAVTLMTTKWDMVHSRDLALLREKELKDSYWEGMLSAGATYTQFHSGDEEYAWNVIDAIIAQYTTEDRLENWILQIQRELVDLCKSLPETAAAQALREKVRIDLNTLQARVQSIKEQAAIRKGRPSPEEQVEINRLQNKIAAVTLDMRKLKPESHFSRFKSFIHPHIR